MEKDDSHLKKKKHRRKKIVNFDEIPGVERIRLSQLVQKLLNAVVGENVTTEKPWIYVDKETIQDNLELHEESSEFLAYKEKILTYTRDQVLLLYIPDEEREYDLFYICLTEKATDIVDEVIRKQQENQQKRLYNAINKKIRYWSPLGSEEELYEITPKRNRPLLEVEVESIYPILPFRITFNFRKVEAARDGYMDFMSTDESQNIIQKKRIDAMVQISPSTISNECQTKFPFPRNEYTQYEYLIKVEPELFNRYIKELKRYSEENQGFIFDQLMVNSHINLYRDDYIRLCEHGESALTRLPEFNTYEFLSFIDVNLCKDKMISSVSWHPLYSGLAAISYIDISLNLRHSTRSTVDEVQRTIHERHLSLIWSFNDKLSPKLILESHREVTFLSFCPFDENLLIGGCSNGQVIIWDIRGKLEKVETEEIMTNAQERYRAYMFSLMNWMKNLYNVAVVRPTAISDLRYSQTDAIIEIRWCSPICEVTKTGKIQESIDRHSCQFFTGSEDGSIAIWDLFKKPVHQAGGFKPQRRLKRLKARPEALMAETSPLKIFHLNLKPLYKVWLPHSSSTTINTALGAFMCPEVQMKYEEIESDPKRRLKLDDRIHYSATPLAQDPKEFSHFSIGTLLGDYMTTSFDGLDFDSGEVVNSETAQVLNTAKYHDGPVQSISEQEGLILTTGGKIFAIWLENFPGRPAMWRKQNSSINYTYGCFNTVYKSGFRVTREDGYIEIWRPATKSKNFIVQVPASSQPLTGSYSHPRKISHICYGNADTYGSLRLYFLPNYYKHFRSKEADDVLFLKGDIVRKKKFLVWQDKWNKNNIGLIEMKKMKEDAARRTIEDKDEKEELVTKKPSKSTLTYIEHEKLDRERRQRENINRMITEKKRLDIPELNRQIKPLQILEQEREKKKRKQRNRLRNAENIFQETVEMLFPEVAKDKEEPPPDPYAGGYSEEEKQSCYNNYMEHKESGEETMIENPFTYVFDWKNVLVMSRDRRVRIEKVGNSHRQRHGEFKFGRPSISVDSEQITIKPEKQLSSVMYT